MTEPPIRLLLVDPDPASAVLLQQALDREGFAVSTSTTPGPACYWLGEGDRFDVLLLDCLLPEAGISRLIALAQAGAQRLPVLLLCLGASEADRVRALESGVDDVLVRPFGIAECVARCRALVRRAQLQGEGSPVLRLTADGIALELLEQEHRLLRNGVEVTLTPREFRLLHFLMAHPGRPWSRDELLLRVRGDLEALVLDPKTVDVHIRWLRLKLETNPSMPQLITTVRGRGYRCG
jgi:two-component system phosphate regulon response regulator PhoB